MGPKDMILKNLELSDLVIKKYLDDLSDADLALRAGRGNALDRRAARSSDRRRANVHRVCEPRNLARAPGRLCR